jgi:predicted nucleic acid-binding protein
MSLAIVLDAGPVGLLCHRRGVAPADECKQWFRSHLARGDSFFLPEIADYEVRRELLRLRKTTSVRRLDILKSTASDTFMPITSDAMLRAADLWASVRQQGRPTADPQELDADVILAAQTLLRRFAQPQVIVATTNPGHLSHFLTAADWRSVSLAR